MTLPRLSLCVLALALSACGDRVNRDIEFGAQYWQHVSVSDAAYQQGPKSQQMLQRDIARCVVELRELERAGIIRDAIPMDRDGRVLDPDEAGKDLARWDTPEREGALLMEHGNYTDFEGCMLAAGWERVKYLPFDVAERARGEYIDSLKAYHGETRYKKRKPQTQDSDPDFRDLND